MLILGLNMFHADASAAIVDDGKILFAVAEERLNRHKHYGGFPALAVKACLDAARREDHRRAARRRGAGQRREPRQESAVCAGESGEDSEFHQDAAAQRVDARCAFAAGAGARRGCLHAEISGASSGAPHRAHRQFVLLFAVGKGGGLQLRRFGRFCFHHDGALRGPRNRGARPRVSAALAGQLLHHDLRFHRLQEIWR